MKPTSTTEGVIFQDERVIESRDGDSGGQPLPNPMLGERVE